MAAIMSWPPFDMRQAVQPQVLKFEDSLLEAERAGVKVQEEMKVAVVLRCITGQLCTYMNLRLSDGLKYDELRETLFKWDFRGEPNGD